MSALSELLSLVKAQQDIHQETRLQETKLEFMR